VATLARDADLDAAARQPRSPRGRAGYAITAMAIGSFAIGTSEFVTMGLLPEIADGVAVSIPTAGSLITAYALGVVVGAPLVAAFGARAPRRALLVGLMAIYALANGATALAPSYLGVTAGRFVAGLPHGAYFGVASLVAASLAAPHRRAKAVSSVMLGLWMANVFGVPAATWLGQNASWRAVYLLIGAVALLGVAAMLWCVPPSPGQPGATVRSELSALRKPQVLLTLLLGTVGFGGMFAMYTYIAPTVVQGGDTPRAAVPLVLAAFGVGGIAGSFVAGKAVDRAVLPTMAVGLVALAGSLALFTWTAQWQIPALLTVFAASVTGTVLVIGLQMRLMDVAGDAQTLGAALNHGSLNVANALGAWLGGLVIAAGWGWAAPSWVGVGLAAVGLAVLAWSVALQRRTDRVPAAAGSAS
jgi:DHA1 family inner membrane transport protein